MTAFLFVLIVNFIKVCVLEECIDHNPRHHYYTMLRGAIWKNIALGMGGMKKHRLLPSLNGSLYTLIKKYKYITLKATL